MERLLKKEIKKQFKQIKKNSKGNDFNEIEAFKLQQSYWYQFVDLCIDCDDLKNIMFDYIDFLFIKYCRLYIEL